MIDKDGDLQLKYVGMYVNDEYEGVGTKWLFDTNVYEQGEWKKH